MKKLLSAFAAFTALTAAASAADLPRRVAPPPVFTPVPVFTGRASTPVSTPVTASTPLTPAPRPSSACRPATPTAASSVFVTAAGAPTTGVLAFGNRNSNDGFVGGRPDRLQLPVHPGSGVVVGIEADAQYVDFGRSRNQYAFATVAGGAINPGTLVFNPNGISGLDFFGTVRGRLGYAWDRTLVYATGGFAYGSGGGRDFGLPNSSRDNFQTGWAVGGGVEYAHPPDSFLNFFRSSAVTLKVEGLYVNLDQGNRNNGVFAQTVNGTQYSVFSPGRRVGRPGQLYRRETEFAVVRAGLNYKFGSY